jgi:hypothetical protein
MSHILLKQVPSSSISTPASTDVKIFSNFNDNGIIYYVDNSGNELPIGYGLSFTPVISTSYNDLYNLYISGQFATGSYYLISDFYSIYEQPDFYFDGTLKTQISTKTSPVRPIVVMAVNNNTLSPYATQIAFPKDKIRYDITWNKTEFNHNAKGRITERIDEYNNRTDYDHRPILFKRYKSYIKDTLITGTIKDFDCVTGVVTGLSTLFLSELAIDDVIVLDTKFVLNYDIGLKVVSISNDLSMVVKVDSLYSGGVPSPVTLYNGSTQIVPINYSFSSESYNAYKTYTNGDYDSYKEIYFGQSDDNDFDEFYTFTSGSYNNTISDFSKYYLSLNNNVLILSNNVFLDTANNNLISGDFYYNSFRSTCIENVISGKTYGNSLGKLRNNQIMRDFYNNSFNDISYNIFSSSFNNNVGDLSSTLMFNKFSCRVQREDFTSSTHVYSGYNCEIFTNSSNVIRLSYYDGSDVLNVVNVTD